MTRPVDTALAAVAGMVASRPALSVVSATPATVRLMCMGVLGEEKGWRGQGGAEERRDAGLERAGKEKGPAPPGGGAGTRERRGQGWPTSLIRSVAGAEIPRFTWR